MVSGSIGIHRTTDPELIKAVLTAENLISDMGGTLPSEIPNPDDFIYLVPHVDKQPMGLIIFVPFNSGTYLGHWGFYKKYRGNGTLEASQASLDYMKEHEGTINILGFTPTCFYGAVKLAQKLGFQIVGKLKKTYLFKNKKYDQIITQKQL
jgi:RimJ/RimL family protein N-acetyltransferase